MFAIPDQEIPGTSRLGSLFPYPLSNPFNPKTDLP